MGLALKNGGMLTLGKTKLISGYQGLIKPPTTVSILSYNRYSTDNFNIKWTLINNNYIKASASSNGNWRIAVFNENDVELTGVSLSMSNWTIPICAFLVEDENTNKIYMIVGQYAITQGQPLVDNMIFNTTIKTYPDGQTINPTINFYSLNADWTDALNGAIIEDENDLDGNTTTGGGGGTHDGTSDTIGVPSVPSFNIFDYGMMSAWGMSSAYLREFSSYLWTSDFFSQIKKLWDNPMENVLSIALLPVDYHVGIEGQGAIIEIGNVRTTAHGDFIDQQFYEIDLGTIEIEEHFGSFLDYSPNTRITLYIPFCSSVELDVDKVMGTTLGVKLHVDILTGEAVAFVTSNDSIITMEHGNIKIDIPISSANYSQMYASFISAGVSTMKALASSGSADASGSASDVVSSLMSAKMNYDTAGSFGLSAGLMTPQYAYICVTYPRQALPQKFKSFRGYPSFITSKLSELTGYTEIYDIKLDNIPATETEKERLLNKLKGGIIL